MRWSARLLVALGCVSAVAATQGTGPGPVAVDFQNVHVHVAPGIILEVRHLQGALIATRAGTAPNFDDIQSYRLRIDAGEVAMTPGSLSRLLTMRVFNGPDPPITDLAISIENGRLRQSGILHKGVPLRFSLVGDLSVTGDGRIRLRPASVKTLGVPATALMKLLHVSMDDLVRSNPSRGFEAHDNDLLLAPDRLLPDPGISGHLTAVRIEGDRVVQWFGQAPVAAPRAAGNYMHYRGNVLRFGRLTMRDTDLRLVDADARDPFEFSPSAYVKQLVAGYSKNAADGSLRVYMPDLDDLTSSPR